MVPGYSVISYAAAYEPFRKVREILGGGLDTLLLSLGGTSVADCEGRKQEVDLCVDEANMHFDVLITVASFNALDYWRPSLGAFLRRNYQHGSYVAAVDIGTWFLAKAGMLANKRATIHWGDSAAITSAHPEIKLAAEGYVIDGRIVTCGGGTAMLPASIEIIENLWGWPVATEVAHMFNIVGRDSKFVQQQNAFFQRLSERDPSLATAVRLMRENIQNPLLIPEIAASVGISQSSLNTAFKKFGDVSAQAFYLKERLTVAQRLVRTTTKNISDIAFACGFASSQSFARAYQSHFGQSATADRQSTLTD